MQLEYNKNDILFQTKQLFHSLHSSKENSIDTKDFCKENKDMDGNPINTVMTNDCLAYLCLYFEQLEKPLKNTKMKNLLDSIFSMDLLTNIKCKCNFIKEVKEKCFNLSIQSVNMGNLIECFQRFVCQETIDGFLCSSCNKKETVEKYYSLSSFPNVLIINLGRFFFNYETFNINKYTTPVGIPMKLNLEMLSSNKIKKAKKDFQTLLFCLKKSSVYNSLYKKKSILNNISRLFYSDESTYDYYLVGLIIHVGGADSGHCYSIINAKRDKNSMIEGTSENMWLEVNDASVKKNR